jgi:hypothetical protein
VASNVIRPNRIRSAPVTALPMVPLVMSTPIAQARRRAAPTAVLGAPYYFATVRPRARTTVTAMSSVVEFHSTTPSPRTGGEFASRALRLALSVACDALDNHLAEQRQAAPPRTYPY